MLGLYLFFSNSGGGLDLGTTAYIETMVAVSKIVRQTDAIL